MLKDSDNRRRELYGKAGCFRFKDFGVEARALSNFWIFNSETIGWVYDQTVLAVSKVLTGEIDPYIEKYSERIVNIINNNLREEASELLKEIEQLEKSIT